MSFTSPSNSRVTIKLKPRAPLRSSVGASFAMSATSSNNNNNSDAAGAFAPTSSSNPFNMTNRGSTAAAASSSAVSVSSSAPSSQPSPQAAHTPEAVARSTPFWQTAIGMLDIVLDPARLNLLIEKEAFEAKYNNNNSNNNSNNSVGGEDGSAATPLLPAKFAALTSGKYSYSCEEACTAVRCICDLGASEPLFKELYGRLAFYISSEVKALVERVGGAGEGANASVDSSSSVDSDLVAIEEVVKLWSAVIRNIVEISTVFMYLDRRYVLQEVREGSIFNVGVQLFKSDIMFRGRSVTAKANSGFAALLEEDRQREQSGHNSHSHHSHSHHHHSKLNASAVGGDIGGTKSFLATHSHYLTRYRDMTLAVQLYFSELEPLIIGRSQRAYTDLGNALLMGDHDHHADSDTAEGKTSTKKAKTDESDNATTVKGTTASSSTPTTTAAVAVGTAATSSSSTATSSSSSSDDASSDDEDDLDEDDAPIASARDFFLGAERLIQSEHCRMLKYLDSRSRAKLDEALQLRLVKPLVPTLFEDDFAKLVRQGRLEDIGRGFKLLCLRHVNEKDRAKKSFTAFVKKWASLFVSQIDKENVSEEDGGKGGGGDKAKKGVSPVVSGEDAFVPNMIALDEACTKIIEVAFTPGYDEEFHAAKSSAFEAALGAREQRASQLLVKFMDGYLRAPSAVLSTYSTDMIGAIAANNANSGSVATKGHISGTKATITIIGDSNASSLRKKNKKKKHAAQKTTTGAEAAALYTTSSPVTATPLTANNKGEFPSAAADAVVGEKKQAAKRGRGAAEEAKGKEEEEEEDVTVALEKALRIFVYMPSKDIFEAFYLREFANRVLLRRSASSETERFVMAKLRGLCGSHLTKQLEGMLKDLEGSLERTDVFRELIRSREEGRVDAFGVPIASTANANNTTCDNANAASANAAIATPTAAAAASASGAPGVGAAPEKKPLPPCPKTTSPEGALLLNSTISTLTQSFWPFFDTFAPSPQHFPAACTAVIAQFEAFYALQFRQRSLTWVHALAQCTVRGAYTYAAQTQAATANNNNNSNLSSSSLVYKDFHGSFLQGLILSVCFPQSVSADAAATEITFDEILRRVCKVDDSTGAPVVTSVGVRTSPSGVILSKAQQAEAEHAIAGTKLTAEQFLIRQLVVCAVIGLLTPKLPILCRGGSPSSASALGGDANNSNKLNNNIFSAEIKDSDVFRVNPSFSCKARSVRLPQVLPKEASKSKGRDGAGGGGGSGGAMGALGGVTDAALLKKIESQRQYLLDATIAKVMKARHTCSHTDLVAAVLKGVGTRFAADASHVKARIEELIVRSFIERDAGDSSIYHFKV